MNAPTPAAGPVERLVALRRELATAGFALPGLVYRAVAGLGDTDDEIAETLRAARVSGQRLRAFRCPLAIWLLRATQQAPGTYSVTRTAVLMYASGGGLPTDRVTLPAPAAGFVRAIDGSDGLPGGRYADLVAAR
jgi:hypothetical protein